MFNNIQITAQAAVHYENQLIERNLGLVVHIARKYRSPHFALDDLISVGSIGLIKAARTYRSEQGARFPTYAGRCITNEVLMFLRKNVRHLKVLSLDAPLNSCDGRAAPVASILGACDEEIEHGLERAEERKALLNAVSRLSPRGQALISMRYGLHGQKRLCQAEVAARLGISQSYVSRLEKQCLRRLRKMLA